MTSANQRLKERWPACLTTSMLLAVALHLLLPWALPAWTFQVPAPRDKTTTFIRLIPTAASEPPSAEADISDIPPVEVQEEVQVYEEPSEPRLPDVFPVIAVGVEQPLPPPSDFGRLSTSAAVRRSEPPRRLGLIAWPEITNPDRMKGYIRAHYNPIFLADGATGTVVLSLWVDARGSVERVRLSESSGFAALDEIAVATFERVVTFSPARDGPRALAVQFDLSVPFLNPW